MLEAINSVRSRVHQSSNMERMEWSSELADMAQEHADGCSLTGNTHRNFSVYSPDEIGENIEVTLATTTASKFVKDAILSWESFSSDYDYDTNMNLDMYTAGLYTQLVWASSRLVGCGVNICSLNSEQFHFLVCDFYPRGNKFGVLPYLTGERCSQCPLHKPKCHRGLCEIDTAAPQDPHFSVALLTGQLLCFTIQGGAGSDFTLLATDRFSLNAIYSESRGQTGVLNALVATYAKRQVLLNITAGTVAIDDKLKLDIGQVSKVRFENGKIALSMAKNTRGSTALVSLGLGAVTVEVVLVNSHLDLQVRAEEGAGSLKGILGQFFHPEVTVNEGEGHLFLPGQLLPLDIEEKPLLDFIHSPDPSQTGLACWTATTSVSG